MKRCFSLTSAAVLGLTLLAGTPSFGKGGHGHSGGSGGGHAHSGGSGHGGGHAHSSGHPSGEHHSSGHVAPSHSTHPQMTHNSPTRPQTHSHPTHPQPAPNQGPAQHVAGVNGTSSQSFTHTGRLGRWSRLPLGLQSLLERLSRRDRRAGRDRNRRARIHDLHRTDASRADRSADPLFECR
jgi:hypothetical protein